MSKKKTPPKKELPRKEKQNVQYKFSRPEVEQLGRDMAEKQISLTQLEADRKQAADEWKSRISTVEAELGTLSHKISRGYEYRDVICTVTLDEPKGKKTCVRDDTGEVVWVRELSEEEKQRLLPLDDEEEAPKA